MNYRSTLCTLLISTSLTAVIAAAQTNPSTPPTPAGKVGAYGWFAQAGWVCGAGASYASPATRPTVQCGGTFSMPLFEFEAGAMGPQASVSNASAYISTNLWLPLVSFDKMDRRHGFPLVIGGYTRMFQTGNALDYGLAYAVPVDSSHSIQFEARDYWAFTSPNQHNVLFRIAWLTGLAD